MGSLLYVIWHYSRYNSWRTAPGLLQCLQNPAQCSTVLWDVINPVWLILRRQMASCKISIHPYPTLAGWKGFRMKYKKKRNQEKKLWQKVNRNLIYIHSHFLVWQISGYWAERFWKWARDSIAPMQVKEESLFFTCAYNHTLIFPGGSFNSIQTNPFHEQFFFRCFFPQFYVIVSGCFWDIPVMGMADSKHKALIHKYRGSYMEMRGITSVLSYDCWWGLGVKAALLVDNPAGVGLSNTNRGIVWLRNKC